MSGGPPFLPPLQSAGAWPAVLSTLHPLDNHPRLVLSALRVLVNLAEAFVLAGPSTPVRLAGFADAVFLPQNLDAISLILETPPTSWAMVTQVNIVACLIRLLCREERHQNALAHAGILDALATKLASFAVAQGEVVPGAELLALNEGLIDCIPDPAPPGLDLASILDAISAIIAESRLRACTLLYSPSILAIFPHVSLGPSANGLQASWRNQESGGLGIPVSRGPGAGDLFLPTVPAQPSRASSSQAAPFLPLGPSLSRESSSSMAARISAQLGAGLAGWDSARFESPVSNGEADAEEPESPLVPWLINLVRAKSGLDRLAAASVLTSLYKAGFASRSRETAMGLLVVPLLMQLIAGQETATALVPASRVSTETATRWIITEETLAVLARLITDSEFLQKAAFDCNAMKIVCKLLKDAYEPLPARLEQRPWNPSPHADNGGFEGERGFTANTLGPGGQLPLHAHRARLRESALKAVAALTSFKDDFRKAFVDQEVMCYVVESLSQSPSKPRSAKERAKSPKEADPARLNPDPIYGGNPVSVLVAACHAVRMLSRSVSILRTTLEDAGIAMPVFHLLRHPEIEVQIAATGTICNLVTEVSPMRDVSPNATRGQPHCGLQADMSQRYAKDGIMKVLCEHAHSLNAPLRLNALWALKHFVHGVGVDMKKACLEELEPGWLVQLICDDTEDEALYARTKNEKQATQPTADDDLDEDMEVDQPEEDGRAWPSGSLQHASFPRTSHERSRTGRLRLAEAKLAALREAELNPVRKARSDDLAIQEQGLNFIRNLIGPGGPDPIQDTTEMIDYLFSQLGQDRLFEILASKLEVKVLHPFSRRFSAGQSSRVLYPQAKIIEAVVLILVHISASVPRHRQLVISQTDLLKALTTHFSSKDKEVRVALCYLASNLTWRDDSTDTQAAAQRAFELRKLGLYAKLEALEQEDSELDVRERAKLAMVQMSQPNFS